MKTAAWLTLIYALIILAGGIFGYIKASSFPSLIMGSISGLLLIVSAIGMFRNIPIFGYIAIAITGILLIFFAYRFFSTWKVFPAAAMGIISIAVLVDLIKIMIKK